MFKLLLTYFLWWIQRMYEQLESILANASKELVLAFDMFRLPIYSNPFIEADIKPPTAIG